MSQATNKSDRVPLGQCPACGRALAAEEPLVRVHAHHYHLGCATYRTRRAGDRAVAGGGADKPDG